MKAGGLATEAVRCPDCLANPGEICRGARLNPALGQGNGELLAGGMLYHNARRERAYDCWNRFPWGLLFAVIALLAAIFVLAREAHAANDPPADCDPIRAVCPSEGLASTHPQACTAGTACQMLVNPTTHRLQVDAFVDSSTAPGFNLVGINGNAPVTFAAGELQVGLDPTTDYARGYANNSLPSGTLETPMSGLVATTDPAPTVGRLTKISLDAANRVRVNVRAQFDTVYSASARSVVAAATATDLFDLVAATPLRVLRFSVSCLTSSGTLLVWEHAAVKRTTANSGGTSATLTPVLMQGTGTTAAQSHAHSYTANPTLGTLQGTLATWVSPWPLQTTGATFTAPQSVWTDDGGRFPLVLATNETLGINFGGVTGTDKLTCDFTVVWSE